MIEFIITSMALALCYMIMKFKNKAGGLCVFAFILTLIRYLFVPSYQVALSYLLHSVMVEGTLLTVLLAVGQFFQLVLYFFLAVVPAIFVFISAMVEKHSGYGKKEKAPKENKEKAPKEKKEKAPKVKKEKKSKKEVEEATEETTEETVEESTDNALEE